MGQGSHDDVMKQNFPFIAIKILRIQIDQLNYSFLRNQRFQLKRWSMHTLRTQSPHLKLSLELILHHH